MVGLDLDAYGSLYLSALPWVTCIVFSICESGIDGSVKSTPVRTLVWSWGVNNMSGCQVRLAKIHKWKQSNKILYLAEVFEEPLMLLASKSVAIREP